MTSNTLENAADILREWRNQADALDLGSKKEQERQLGAICARLPLFSFINRLA